MKNLILSACLICSFSMAAQKDSLRQTEYYLQFSFSDYGRTQIFVNFGKEYLGKDQPEIDSVASVLKSIRHVEDALKLLNSRGWKLVSFCTATREERLSFYYIMKREL
jgi:hypothetical protein